MSAAQFEHVAETARRLKLEKVRAHGAEADEEAADLHPSVLAVRDGDIVAQVFVGPGPDGMRQACYWSALLLRPHEVYLVADSRMTTVDLDAHPDGLNIEHGQLQEEWEAGQREHITECLVIYRIPRIGQATLRTYPYDRHGRHLIWREVIGGDEMTATGALPDAVTEGYRDCALLWTDIEATFVEAFGANELLDAELHKDRAAAKFLSSRCPGAVVAMEVDND